MLRLLVVLTGFLTALSAGAQSGSQLTRPVLFHVEAGGYGVSGPQTPFWLRANQYGIVPLTGSSATLRVGVTADYRQPARRDSLHKAPKVDWGYGLDVVGNATGSSKQVLLPEAYVKARWGKMEVYAGRRREIVGLVDTLLTSGSYAWSGNALPIPKVQVNTRGFVPVPLTKGLIAVNALFNYGWFANADRRVLDTRLHQKALYVRLGKPNWPVKLYGGINHQVVWGGHSMYLSNGVSNNGKLPTGLNAYYYIVTALPYPTTAVDQNVSSIDEGNRIGNHLGSIDVGIEISLPAGRLLLYRQNPYDTGAIFYLTSIADGLNGLSYRRKQPGTGGLTVDQVLVEWLYTKSQGGDEFVISDPQRRGRVNYFNNSQYIDGWTYYGHTIGTPFLTPRTDVNRDLPVGYAVANNRVSLLHVGLSGQIAQRVQWLAKLSYSRNFGTYDIPYPDGTNQFSALLTASAPLNLPVLGPCRLLTSVAADQGKLLYNSSGVYVSLRKVFATSPAARPAVSPRAWPTDLLRQ